MSKLLLSVCLLVNFNIILKAQTTFSFTETLEWSKISVLGNAALNQYEEIWTVENYKQLDQDKRIPVYGKNFPVSGYGTLKAEITNVKYDDNIDLGEIKIDPELLIRHTISKERSNYYATVNIVPIQEVQGRLRAIVSFELNVIFTPENRNINRKRNNTYTSVLSDGSLYKMAVSSNGVYKITGAYLQNELGIDLSDINPSTLKLYSNKGGRLPEIIAEPRADDLTQLRIKLVGTEDGNFSANDYIVFYAEGPDELSFNTTSKEYFLEKNIYDDSNYVFLKLDGEAGLRVNKVANGSSSSVTLSVYEKIIRYEEDRINLLGANSSTQGSGKRWFGSSFETQNNQDFSSFFTTPGATGTAKIEMAFAGRSSESSRVSLNANGTSVNTTISSVRTEDPESLYARIRILENEIMATENFDISVLYESFSGQRIEGWLDYIQLITPVTTLYRNEPLYLKHSSTLNNANASFNISGLSSGLSIWQITNWSNIAEIDYDGSSNFFLNFSTNDQLQEFVVFDESQLPTPRAIGDIDNQNLHGIDRTDMVVIYHPQVEESARNLVNHRAEWDNLNIEMVNVLDIYNEFSSGRVDPTAIRDFARMIYLRDPEFKYLLLFGDGSYDYMGKLTTVDNQSLVPVYQTDRHLEPIYGYPSDDYYGLLDDEEGDDLDGGLDIAVGRIPVATNDAGQNVVNKIIHYQTSTETLGNWRCFAGFVADDEDGNLHLNQNEEVSNSLQQKIPQVNVSKVYYDSFIQESTPGGQRYPNATAAITEDIESGHLIYNYLGHGGPKGWAQERVLQVNDIINLKNFDQLTALITATCSFTGYDDPELTTAGEECILNPIGGAISLMTTVRSVFATDNKRLAQAVIDTIYTRDNGKFIPLGEVMRRAKNSDPSLDIDNLRKFALIGDPSMTLNIPEHNIVTVSINGKDISSTESDTIGALQKVNVRGIITGQNGQQLDNFNGILSPIVYDKKSVIRTLANDDGSIEKNFSVQKNIIFKGKASVTNGEFSFDFVVPKDIDYSFGKGKISYYAENGTLEDAWGYSDDFIIGGTSAEGFTDDEGPQMQLFMNNESFVSGEQTDANPTLLVNLQDDLGINITGTSIGHDITAVLDGDNSNTFILNDFYSSVVDDFTQGSIEFPLEDLAPGLHNIKVKAFDVANNSTEGVIEFMVVENSDGKLSRVLNYPNPFTTNTNFWFEHDLNDISINTLVNIYTISGKLVRQIQANSISRNGQVRDISWNGTDEYGNPLAKGVYLYKITATDSSGSNKRTSNTEKLVILK